MTTTHAVDLLLRNLPETARLGHRLPGLVNNLLSVATLVDAGCDVYFHRTGCEVSLDGKVILRGWRDPTNRLWRVRITDDGWTTNFRVLIPPDMHEPPLIPSITAPTTDAAQWDVHASSGPLSCVHRGVTPPSPRGCTGSPSRFPAATITNSLYECSNTHKLTHFYYACLNFPVKSTLVLAIKAGYLKGFPGLTVDRVRRHINVDVASERGHMDQVRQGQRSTKPAASSIPIVLPRNRVDSNMDPQPQQPSNERTQHVFLTVHDVTGSIASDQTGRFPVMSNRGNSYVALFYVFDPNYIKSVPIRNRSKSELLRAYTKVYAWLTARGYRPLLHKLDNETSRDVEAFVAAE